MLQVPRKYGDSIETSFFQPFRRHCRAALVRAIIPCFSFRLLAFIRQTSPPETTLHRDLRSPLVYLSPARGMNLRLVHETSSISVRAGPQRLTPPWNTLVTYCCTDMRMVQRLFSNVHAASIYPSKTFLPNAWQLWSCEAGGYYCATNDLL